MQNLRPHSRPTDSSLTRDPQLIGVHTKILKVGISLASGSNVNVSALGL
jgi:hypothetical protein